MRAQSEVPIDLAEIYGAFFKRSVEGLLVLNKDRTILLVNPRAEKLLGYKKGELNNIDLDNIVPPRFHNECHKLCDDFFGEKNHSLATKSIVTLLRKNNVKMVTEVSMSDHLHSNEGSLMVVLFTDITETYKAKQALKKEKNLYENVLETIGDAFISFDRNWKFTYINSVALSFMGVNKKKEDFIGKVFWEAFPEVTGTELETNFREVMEHRKTICFEAYSPFRKTWSELRVCPHDTGIAIFSRDISGNKKNEEELRNSEARFMKAFRSSPIALAISSLAEGYVLDVNDCYLKLLGYETNEVVGKTASELELFQFCESGERDKITRHLLEKGAVVNSEIKIRKKSGEAINILFSAEIIDLNDQNYIITTIIDITAKKQAEEVAMRMNEVLERKVQERTIELTEALERERENNELKSRFVTMASHEFKTPLTGLLTSVYILEQYTKPEENEKLAKHFNLIKSSVNNLTEILNEFLSLEKIEHGKTKVLNTSFNLQNLIDNTIEEIKGYLKKGQHINYIHTGDAELFQDKRILHNSLLNLISNAIKYSPEDKQIDINSEIINGRVTITIKDYGIGIPERDQKNMFTLFFRARNAETIQGTGLGLNIVKKYMRLIEGTINYVSKEGEGSTFTLRFPSIAIRLHDH